MIFVIGGAFSGKSGYVRERFGVDAVDGAAASLETLKSAAAVKNFHLFLKNALNDGKDVTAEIDAVLTANPDIIIISNELGCGVVPIEKQEREYREAVGRAHTYISKKAERVIRVVCGIGQTIK